MVNETIKSPKKPASTSLHETIHAAILEKANLERRPFANLLEILIEDGFKARYGNGGHGKKNRRNLSRVPDSPHIGRISRSQFFHSDTF